MWTVIDKKGEIGRQEIESGYVRLVYTRPTLKHGKDFCRHRRRETKVRKKKKAIERH